MKLEDVLDLSADELADINYFKEDYYKLPIKVNEAITEYYQDLQVV